MSQHPSGLANPASYHARMGRDGLADPPVGPPARLAPSTARDPALALSLEERKGQLLERIERQRLLRRTRRLQAAIAALQARDAGQSPGQPGAEAASGLGILGALGGLWGRGSRAAAADGEFPRSQLMRAITQQPLLTAGAVGVLLMLGPRRLARLASWVLPLVLRRMG